MTDDPAMEDMFDQIEVASFEKRANEMINKANKTGELPYGMTLEIDRAGDIDHTEGFVTCKAQIPSPQQIKNEDKIFAKKIQVVAVEAEENWERSKEFYKKIREESKTANRRKYASPVHIEGMNKLLEWSKRQEAKEELMMKKLYPLREWAKRINP